MDRAGYCFGSTLGQTVYDNQDCVGKSVSLSAADADLVAEIRALEASQSCRVNTSQTNLEVDDTHIRSLLVDLPIRAVAESACIGWTGPTAPLYAGRGSHTPEIGQIATGDNVTYSHIPVDGWTYVIARDASLLPKSGGWLDLSIPDSCAQFAG